MSSEARYAWLRGLFPETLHGSVVLINALLVICDLGECIIVKARFEGVGALEMRIGLLAPVEIGIVAAKLVPLFEDGKKSNRRVLRVGVLQT